jgi:uncharacterized protein YjiS (DUF1127 family)
MPRFAIEHAWVACAVGVATMAWRWLARTNTRLRRKRQQRRELQLLDQETFRDLGLDRSELGSYEAEAAGAVNRTRRRVCNAHFG